MSKDKAEKKKNERVKYESGSATKGTTVDLNDVNFKNKHAQVWSEKKGGEARTSSGGNLSFGGKHLKGSKMRLHRKKGNRSTK